VTNYLIIGNNSPKRANAMTLFALILFCVAAIITWKRPAYARIRFAMYQIEGRIGQTKMRIGTLIGLLLFTTYPSSAQQRLTLTVGQLNYLKSVQGIEQHFSVKNETPSVVASVIVTCGFFNNGQLIASERTLIENIAGNATGFGKIFAFSNISPDRTQCRLGPTF
jgi:hypothetical protein